uniref:Uncharacterized protein n=1 Tax=Lepeophtheirus salmonis TaxID=72036 RepID=A0A0K2UXG9_LEPSM
MGVREYEKHSATSKVLACSCTFCRLIVSFSEIVCLMW